MSAADEADLVELMNEVARAEDRGDVDFFERLLHATFVMQRPNGQFEDRRGFIGRMAAGGTRRTGPVQVQLFGNRAVAWADVDKLDGDTSARYHNLRVFTRPANGSPWQLVAWLNEPVDD